MVYNFNRGISWASTGIEYAQAYRAGILRKIGKEARFIFTNMFPKEALAHMTANIGFRNEEVLWLYTFFTDFKTAPVSYTLSMLEAAFGNRTFRFSREGKTARYDFDGDKNFYKAYMVDEESDLVHRVEMVSQGKLVRKDYYTYGRIYSEYYAPLDGKAHMYLRRFFNEDGSVAYDEITDDDQVMYQFPDKLLCSKEELIGYMVESLQLTKEDVVLIDRTRDNGQPILMNVGPAKVGVVIHAEHYIEGSTGERHILWNNYYEYAFSQWRHIDFYVVSTEVQKRLISQHFLTYKGIRPNVVAIPAGSLDELKYPTGKRNPHSLITASRLASEKHVDWLVDAVAAVHEQIPDITLDIYGKGDEEERLHKKIEKAGAGDYIRLMGHHELTEVYQGYEAYISASTGEGFGLTLLEAVGAGLPVIGFDVRYGNQTFIEDGKNGYLIPVHERMKAQERIQELSDRLVRLFTDADWDAFSRRSYEIAKQYLTAKVEEKWKKALEM